MHLPSSLEKKKKNTHTHTHTQRVIATFLKCGYKWENTEIYVIRWLGDKTLKFTKNGKIELNAES